MKDWIIRLITLSSLFFCSFECEKEDTFYYIQNLTEDIVIIHSYMGSHYDSRTCTLNPKESFELYRFRGAGNIYAISGHKISMSTKEGTLLRYWCGDDNPKDLASALEGCHASYFKECGVRQLHDGAEWILTENGEIREYVFRILPEDLVPLSEITCEKHWH